MTQNNKNTNTLIKCDNDELQRRIASYIARKRSEIDTLNVREFCSLSSATDTEYDYSCARVDAVFVRRFGNKGHVKVSKASNDWGPQMIDSRLRAGEKLQNPPAKSMHEREYSEGVEERLRSLEMHLKIVPKYADVNDRLKEIEDRILFLKGLSPEYLEI
ncbi:hypothetical protein CHUAL_004623 [Chamberlinius hualienensis]